MTTTFDKVADLIAESCDVAREDIRPQSDLTEDLGLDSVDIYDLCFALEETFGIELPMEEIAEQAAAGQGEDATPAELPLATLCDRIDTLIAAKQA